MKRIIIAFCIAAVAIAPYSLLALGYHVSAPVAQAAQPAPVEVAPCEAINTAKVNDTFTITVFKCEPQNAAPYLLNTVGFMKDVE